MKRPGLSFCLFFACITVSSASSQTQPVNCTEVMAWLTSGISTDRLVRIVQERGIAAVPGKAQIRQFESAGANANLARALSGLKPSIVPSGVTPNASCEIPPILVQAAEDAGARRFHQAELTLRQVSESDPQNAALHFALGTMLRQQELWDDAFDEITLSAKLMPDFPENHSTLAYIFYRLDDGPNSIAEARTALSMDPQNAEAYQILGLGLYSNEQYAASAHAYAESLARDPNNADTYYDLGIALHAAGNPAGAVAAYRNAIHLNSAFWQAHSNLALILHEQHSLDEAISEYREAKRLAPDDPSVRNNLGNTYCDKGDFEAAIVELRQLYQLHPEWVQGHPCLARAYMSKKDYGSAINEFRLAVQQDPNGSAEHRGLGEALLLDDRVEESVRELQLAVALNPDSEAAHHSLGTALFREQQNEAAEKEFREALRLNPSPDNHYSLAACLMSMDRYNEALAELDIAARLDPERQLYRARRDELVKLMRQPDSR